MLKGLLSPFLKKEVVFIRLLFIGDVYGNDAIYYLKENLEKIKQDYKPNLIIVNAENASNGYGICEKQYRTLMSLNISLITMGNHTFGNGDIYKLLDDEKTNIIRPLNYENTPGNGYKIINYNGKKLLVINLLGRSFMDPNVSNPFILAKQLLKKYEDVDYTFIDFHAEATSEKLALAYYLDRPNLAIVGTHTHVQTADERTLLNGCLFLSDVGMTGPYDGVLGVDRGFIIEKFLKGYAKNKQMQKGRMQLSACLIDYNKKEIKRIHIHE